MISKVKEKFIGIFVDLKYSYRKGCDRFGFWWTLFTVSLLSLAVVFFLFAILLAVLFL